MDGKICLITGANSGIGKQAALQLAAKGCHVIMACRHKERGQAALTEILTLHPGASVELALVDLGLRNSILDFVQKLKTYHDRLDVLIHNAAIFNVSQKERELTAEGRETLWASNHLGPVLLTELVLPLLQKSGAARILTVSSKGLLAKPFLKVDLHDPEFSKRRFSVVNAYYQSKLAQMMYTFWLAPRLKADGITVNCLRVPAVQIDLARHPELSSFVKWVYSLKAKNSLSPQAMAETYTQLALSEQFSQASGKYFDEQGKEVDPGAYCKNAQNIKALMLLTASFVPEVKGFV